MDEVENRLCERCQEHIHIECERSEGEHGEGYVVEYLACSSCGCRELWSSGYA
ncbi:MAG: hypothetical protein ABIG61_07160 [Planctomycetota bacterium]